MLQIESNNKHILYIGRALNSIDGGAIVSKRNVEILSKISEGNLIEFYLSDKTILDKFLNIILGNPWGYSKSAYKNIKKAILLNDISCVFIDHSLLGGFAGLLKRFNVNIVAFFHNVEVKYYSDKVLVDGFLNNLMVSYAKKNEKQIIINANKIICLTDFDSDLLKTIYGRQADLVLPITISDKFKVHTDFDLKENYHLFVGSSFFANIEGIKWYVTNVLPFVGSKLIIVGTGMGTLSKEYANNPKIEIYDFVPDLGPLYYQADFVINPVRLGSGMKTKTIEALMYGKTVIGTLEAFSGIEKVENFGVGHVCTTPEEFINCIKKFSGEKFNTNSRNYYLKSFSADFGYNKLKHFLAEL